MTISKSDAQAIIRYLNDAALFFEAEARQTYIAGLNGSKMSNKARMMRKLTKKLLNKLNNH